MPTTVNPDPPDQPDPAVVTPPPVLEPPLETGAEPGTVEGAAPAVEGAAAPVAETKPGAAPLTLTYAEHQAELAKVQSAHDKRTVAAEKRAAAAEAKNAELTTSSVELDIQQATTRYAQMKTREFERYFISKGVDPEVARESAAEHAAAIAAQTAATYRERYRLARESEALDQRHGVSLQEAATLTKHRIANEHGISPEELELFSSGEQMAYYAKQVSDARKNAAGAKRAPLDTGGAGVRPDSASASTKDVLEARVAAGTATDEESTRLDKIYANER